MFQIRRRRHGFITSQLEITIQPGSGRIVKDFDVTD
jgi:hypothetical protein